MVRANRDSDLEPHLGAGGVPVDPPVVRQRDEEEQTTPVAPPVDLRRVEARALIADTATRTKGPVSVIVSPIQHPSTPPP